MKANSVKYTFTGMNQDVSEGKHPSEFYYEAHNIRLLTTDKTITGGVSFEKGNELKLSLPSINIINRSSKIQLSNGVSISYINAGELDTQIDKGLLQKTSGDQTIIGHTCSRDSVILFATDDQGMDTIWEMNMDDYTIKLLYLRNLGFSSEHPIQAIYNYENRRIEKVYWIDGINQSRFINIKHSLDNQNKEDLINLNSNALNMVGNFKISQPKIIEVVSGGTHTAGMTQYAYNLYRLNGAQTKLSPITELIPLSKGANLGGGDVNEIVGSTPVIRIDDIDKEFTHIKVYAIKYTSYNQTPSISLIEDKEVPSTRSISIFDEGSILGELSLEEFLFLGSDPIIPKHIESKDNVLFSSNIKEKNFDVDLDMRAYSFNKAYTAEVYDNVRKVKNRTDPTGDMTPLSAGNYNLRLDHDSVNLNYSLFKYQATDNSKLGGEGKYIKYEIVQDETITNPEKNKYLKDNEVYRFGIEFYNRLGQKSFPKWIGDYRMPEGNLEGKYNTLKITLKDEFYVWLNDSANFESEDDKPVGYRVLRANRTQNDKTIITQGFLNGFMSNFNASDKSKNFSSQSKYRTQHGKKLPSLQRVYGKHNTQMEGMKHGKTLGDFNAPDNQREVHKASSSDYWVAETFQYNILMQMFSPEVMFSNVSLYENLELRIKGAHKNLINSFWGQERNTTTKRIIREGKVLNGLTPHEGAEYSSFISQFLTDPNAENEVSIVGPVNDLADKGIYGAANARENSTMDFFQFYRSFAGGFVKSTVQNVVREIYGKPELTEKGQGGTNYNSDPKFNYYNTLEPMMADGGDSNKGKDENAPSITSVNSWGAKCLTMVLGPDDVNMNPVDRPTLESLHTAINIPETNVMLVAELVKNDIQIYLGGIYGGNTYEDKKRTQYIQIGDYSNIENEELHITSPGDTFVQKFTFGKMLKTDTEVYTAASKQFSEIIEGVVETTVDLSNRNDMSFGSWDGRFQPRYNEFHQYNRVYSQQPTLTESQDVDYNFKKINNFDTRILATKVKIPGEYIDSWTDLLVNESLDLNGQYGRITSMCNYRDNIYAFQDNAFSIININPRVQTQGEDGISIELGSGRLLHDYKYISTVSGTLNKWGVEVTNNGIYFLDGFNKSIMRFTGQGLEGLSSVRGLHEYLVNNLNLNDLKLDNPLKSKGVSMGYDVLNNDVYLTYNNLWTLCFNEKLDQFIGFYSYNAPIYIYTKERLLTVNPGNHSHLYETHAGPYNVFYGNTEPSKLVFIANPEVDHECIFNNLEYKSVATDDNNQEQRYTWEQIRIHNEFQDSGYRSLDAKNLKKRNRKYRLAIPRNQNSTDRIRNNWAFIELQAINPNSYFYVNQDIVLHYIANHIMIR